MTKEKISVWLRQGKQSKITTRIKKIILLKKDWTLGIVE